MFPGSAAEEEIKCPAIADTSIAAHPREVLLSLSGGTRIRIKGDQHFFAAEFDTSRAKGLTVEEAWLLVHNATERAFKTNVVSTISAGWDERTSCYLWTDRSNGRKLTWAGPGSAFLDVAFGWGGSIVNSRNMFVPPDGWGKVRLDPKLAQALVSGDQRGIAMAVEFSDLTNYDVFSREQWGGKVGPYLVLRGVFHDRTPPARVTDLRAEPGEREGEVVLTWTAPGDDGTKGRAARYEFVLLAPEGARVTLDAFSRLHLGASGPFKSFWDAYYANCPIWSPDLPIKLRPKPSGGRERLVLRFSPAAARIVKGWRVAVRAVDEVGNEGVLSNFARLTPKPWGAPNTSWLPSQFLRLRLTGVVPRGRPSQKGATKGRVSDLVARPGIDRGEVVLTWTAPEVPSGEVERYEVLVHSGRGEPRVVEVRPTDFPLGEFAPPGGREQVSIEGLDPGKVYRFAVRAVGKDGRRTPLSNLATSKPSDSGWRIWAVGDAEKVNPISGNTLERHRDEYQGEPQEDRPGGVWDRHRKEVFLLGGRNEFVAFQLVVERACPKLERVRIRASDLVGERGVIGAHHIELFREGYVNVKGSWYPDPLIPMTLPGWEEFDVPGQGPPLLPVEGQRNQAVWVDIYIPHGTPPGEYRGRLTIEARGQKPAQIGVRLFVSSLVLPDELHLDGELNCYNNIAAAFPGVKPGTPEYIAIEREYHRLAHKHRLTLNILPYNQHGRIIGDYAPPLEGRGEEIRVADWTEWDRHFGPYLDGSAFSDLPRRGVPVAHFYLPFHENWPSPLEKFFKNRREFEEEFTSICRQFKHHFEERGWTRTQFQVYFNNKKRFGFCPWDLDEPWSDADFEALRTLGSMAERGFSGPGNVKVVLRVDISRFHLHRGQLYGIFDLWNISAAWARRPKFTHFEALRRRGLGESIWFYDGRFGIADPCDVLLEWGLKAWDRGAQGFCIWNAIGMPKDWTKPSENPTYQNAIIYPGLVIGYNGPIPSLRLKVLRRAVQNFEVLHMIEPGGYPEIAPERQGFTALWSLVKGTTNWPVSRQGL